MSRFASTRDAVVSYLRLGLAPIPVRSRSKAPRIADWPAFRLAEEQIDMHFPEGDPSNVGILNGAPSRNHVDVDLDCPEARAVAEALLPRTGWVFGRASSPRAHHIFQVDSELARANRAFSDTNGERLLDLRGNGSQTVVPPSVHESGEQIEWNEFGEVGCLPLAELTIAVERTAAAALIARHWPAEGSRDDAALALTGALVRAGWSDETISQFVLAVATAAHDEEAAERASKAERARRAYEQGDPIVGWPRLAEILREGEDVVRLARDWLRLSSEPLAPAASGPQGEATEDFRPWPEPLAAEALTGPAGDFVRLVLPHTEADEAALLFQFLTAFGSRFSGRAALRVGQSQQSSNEFLVVVGQSSRSRKGTALSEVLAVFQAVDAQWALQNMRTGLSTGEGLIRALADVGEDDRHLLVVETEFARPLINADRQGNNLSTVIRQVWDGSSLGVMTRSDPLQVPWAAVTIIGHVTEDELDLRLNHNDRTNGFANRLLWVAVRRSKILPFPAQPDASEMEALVTRLRAAVDSVRTSRNLVLDPQAHAYWANEYVRLSADVPGNLGPLLARAEVHVLRLAMIYALLDATSTISEVHLRAAVAAWAYVERSVHYLFGQRESGLAARVRRILELESPLARSAIMARLGGHVTAHELNEALRALQDAGRATPGAAASGGPGRRPQTWRAVG